MIWHVKRALEKDGAVIGVGTVLPWLEGWVEFGCEKGKRPLGPLIAMSAAAGKDRKYEVRVLSINWAQPQLRFCFVQSLSHACTGPGSPNTGS